MPCCNKREGPRLDWCPTHGWVPIRTESTPLQVSEHTNSLIAAIEKIVQRLRQDANASNQDTYEDFLQKRAYLDVALLIELEIVPQQKCVAKEIASLRAQVVVLQQELEAFRAQQRLNGEQLY